MKNKKFICIDCKVNTSKIGEHYFIKDSIWLSVAPKKGMLCIGCLEKRLKRKLTKNDFTPCYINNPNFSGTD